MIARNADEATWDAIHAKAQAATGSVERTSLYELLGRRHDEALARRALDLALTDEPGKTISAGMITAVAGEHPRMAVDFVLAHLAQVNQLVDISGRSRFMQRLAGGSNDASLIATLEAYASANLAASDRKPIDQAIDRIRFESGKLAAGPQRDRRMAARRIRPSAVDRAPDFAIGARLASGSGRPHRPRQLLLRAFVRGLNLQPRRGQESFGAGHRFVVRCLGAAPPIQLPTDFAARVSPGHLLNLARSNSGETLELAWIDRKKPIWSTS